jgi:abortive infection bacteriophage resistance protein
MAMISKLHQALKMDDNKKIAKKYSLALKQAKKAMAMVEKAE